MGIGFLAPLFLAGLAAVAVPLIAHLRRRPPSNVRRFPSLMLIRGLRLEARGRRRLTDRDLLALRCLALALIALAFARPFPTGLDAPAGHGTDLVVVVDRSYSMGGPGEGQERLAAALAPAFEALAALGPGDRAAVVAFDSRAEVTSRLAPGPGEAERALRRLSPTGRGTDLAAGLDAATRLLANSPAAATRRVLLVSDLQRTGLPPGRRLRLPEGVRLALAPAPPPAGGDLAVVGVEARAGAAPPRRRLAVRVRATGAPLPDAARRLTVEVDGRTVDTRPLDLAPGEEDEIEIELVAPARGAARVRLATGPDALPGDDVLRVALGARRPIRVLLVETTPEAAREALYVAAAAGLADDPPAAIRRIGLRGLVPALRGDREGPSSGGPTGGPGAASPDVVVLAGLAGLDDAAALALADFVARGGGVLGLLGPGGAPAPGAAGALAALLGGQPGAAVEAATALRAAGVDRGQELLAWLGEADEASLRAAPLWRYRAFAPATGTRTLVRLENGAPALTAAATGEGRVLVLTPSLSPERSGLALSAPFAPLIVEALRHLARRAPVPLARTAGEALDLATLPGGRRDRFVTTPGGERRRIPAARAALGLDDPGFYEVVDPRAPADPVVVAVNTDPAESDPAAFAPEALLARVERTVRPSPAAGPAPAVAAASPWWWYLLVAALAAIALESWLAGRRAKTGTGAGRGRPAERRPASPGARGRPPAGRAGPSPPAPGAAGA